jgi:Spy/CpxP family protein refolding chaperone
MSVLLGVLAGVAVGKLVLHRRRRWMTRHGGGGGCGGGHGRFRRGGGEGDAHAVGGEGAAPDEGGRGFAFRWFQRRARGAWGQAPEARSINLGEVLGELELNGRQKDEAEEVFDTIRGALGGRRFTRWDALGAVLGAVGSEPFDRAAVELAVDAEGQALAGLKKEVVDGVEHLHDILTAEQRAKLRTTLAGDAARA